MRKFSSTTVANTLKLLMLPSRMLLLVSPLILLTLTRLVDSVYQQLKGSDRLDNADLLRACNQALEHHPSIARTSTALQADVVDEFQDTDLLQVSIIDKLSRDRRANVMTVGDAAKRFIAFVGPMLRFSSIIASCNSKRMRIFRRFRSLIISEAMAMCPAFVETIFSRPDFFGDRFLALRPQGAVSKDAILSLRDDLVLKWTLSNLGAKGGGIDDARRLGSKAYSSTFCFFAR